MLFETRPPQLFGSGYVGKGVDTLALERVADQFLVDQLRLATANEAGAAKYSELLDQIDESLRFLGQSMDQIQAFELEVEQPAGNLDQLRQELDQGLEVARRVEQRMQEMDGQTREGHDRQAD